MGRLGHWIGTGVLAAVVAAGGCAFEKKPYATDPLLRRGRGVWGDTVSARPPESIPTTEPTAPKPPPGPLIGDPIVAAGGTRSVTSP